MQQAPRYALGATWRLRTARNDKTRKIRADPCKSVARFLLHEAAGVFFAGATDGQAVYFDGRNADADRDGLAVFAAGADAFVEFQIVADHGDASEHVGAVADQGCALDRGGDLAIFDQVSF